ncbi:MAG TPA: DUF4908 domain-containing protein [Rhizomicrobium sp.]|jgi:hypothetical protein
MGKSPYGFAALAALALTLAFAPGRALGQDSFQERLSTDRLGYVEPGTYLAADRIGFSLDASGANYLLRFDGSPEIFVLYPDNASMGGRVLKYDSGETALHVSGWGGMTLYTDPNPRGLPAVRTGDSTAPGVPDTSVADIENAAQDDAEHLAYARRLKLGFTADWNAIADSATGRAFALDALENAARGLDRFGANPAARETLGRRVNMVMLLVAPRPALMMNGKTLVVTFDPKRGYAGCASSRAIARALKTLLGVPQKQS